MHKSRTDETIQDQKDYFLYVWLQCATFSRRIQGLHDLAVHSRLKPQFRVSLELHICHEEVTYWCSEKREQRVNLKLVWTDYGRDCYCPIILFSFRQVASMVIGKLGLKTVAGHLLYVTDFFA